MRILLSILSLSILVSCSGIKEGEIYKKEFRPAHTQLMMIPMIISNGKSTTTIIVPYFYHYPDRYVVYIKGRNEKGKEKTNCIYTIKEVFLKVEVGDYFTYNKQFDLLEEPYTKEKQK